MNLTISDTKVEIIGDKILGFALNNLVNEFVVTTDKGAEWDYTLYVYMLKPKKYNVINLNRKDETTIYVDLTADMMPFDGRYEMQLVANKYDTGETFRSEKFQVWVENSIDPQKEWTPVPSEFYQIEDHVQKMYKEIKEIASGCTLDVDSIYGGNAFGIK